MQFFFPGILLCWSVVCCTLSESLSLPYCLIVCVVDWLFAILFLIFSLFFFHEFKYTNILYLQCSCSYSLFCCSFSLACSTIWFLFPGLITNYGVVNDAMNIWDSKPEEREKKKKGINKTTIRVNEWVREQNNNRPNSYLERPVGSAEKLAGKPFKRGRKTTERQKRRLTSYLIGIFSFGNKFRVLTPNCQ